MKGTFKEMWLQDYTLDEAANAILWGRNLAEFQATQPRLLDLDELPFEEKLRVLDFGCGMGRGLVFGARSRPYWTFMGYDNAVMLSRIKQVWKQVPDSVRYTDDWDYIKTSGLRGEFDIVYADLVLQHLHIEHLHQYLADFNTFTRASPFEEASLIVHGRRVLDDLTTEVWPIVLEYFDIRSSYDVLNEQVLVGDPHDHFCVRFLPKDL